MVKLFESFTKYNVQVDTNRGIEIISQQKILDMLVVKEGTPDINTTKTITYKGFLLEVFGVVLHGVLIDEEDYSIISYYKGCIKVADRNKLSLKSLIKHTPHAGWQEIKENCLSFSCNNDNDLYLIKSKEKNILLSCSNYELNYFTFKNYDWVFNILKEIIDKEY